MIALAAGSFMGQFFEYRFFINTGLMSTSAWLWWRTSPVKVIVRFILQGVAMWLCFMPKLAGPPIVELIPEEYAFWRALVDSCFTCIIPCFLCAFVTFGLLRFVFFKLSLDNTEVQGKEFETREQYLRDVGLELDLDHSGRVGGMGSKGVQGRMGRQQRGTGIADDSSIELETI